MFEVGQHRVLRGKVALRTSLTKEKETKILENNADGLTACVLLYFSDQLVVGKGFLEKEVLDGVYIRARLLYCGARSSMPIVTFAYVLFAQCTDYRIIYRC